MPDDLEPVSLTEHEEALRESFSAVAELDAADWATSSLAVVIHRTSDSGWANRSPDDFRRRALVLLAIRLLRAGRAGMAVLGAGWEVEARAMDRLVIETRARQFEVAEDRSDETGRRWLEGKLKAQIGEAIEASFPAVGSADVKRLYKALSQDSHADPGGIFRTLAEVDGEQRADILWGPRRTIETRRSLLMYSVVAAEAATLLAGEAGVEHPDPEALSRHINAVADGLRSESDGDARFGTRGQGSRRSAR